MHNLPEDTQEGPSKPNHMWNIIVGSTDAEPQCLAERSTTMVPAGQLERLPSVKHKHQGIHLKRSQEKFWRSDFVS